ncbi:MAG: ABC transporter substrate-binding protein, partial [Usitatibacter sp.]
MNRLAAWLSGALVALSLATAPAMAQQPLKIGFGMSLTGPLAGNGKAALIAMDIWKDDVNAKGGILGRKVEFVYYDDQTNPSTVPSIYSKLLDVDKVDLVVSGYGTNVIAPAMPIMMQRNMTFMGLFGLNVNSKFDYDRYFQIMPAGPDPAIGWTQGFFDTAMGLNPRPQTIALVGADAEYPALALSGARVLAVDLSLASLACAKRQTPPALAGVVEFAQADILALGSLGRTFDLINAGGVLHHMSDPMAGWRELIKLMQPDGFMQVGLYSELARSDVVAARAEIAQRGYRATPVDIRRCR